MKNLQVAIPNEKEKIEITFPDEWEIEDDESLTDINDQVIGTSVRIATPRHHGFIKLIVFQKQEIKDFMVYAQELWHEEFAAQGSQFDPKRIVTLKKDKESIRLLYQTTIVDIDESSSFYMFFKMIIGKSEIEGFFCVPSGEEEAYALDALKIIKSMMPVKNQVQKS